MWASCGHSHFGIDWSNSLPMVRLLEAGQARFSKQTAGSRYRVKRLVVAGYLLSVFSPIATEALKRDYPLIVWVFYATQQDRARTILVAVG
jgi:hypothetical protein